MSHTSEDNLSSANINTDGGGVIAGDVYTDGNFIGRDKVEISGNYIQSNNVTISKNEVANNFKFVVFGIVLVAIMFLIVRYGLNIQSSNVEPIPHMVPSPVPLPTLPTIPPPTKSRIAIADFIDRSQGVYEGIDPAGYIYEKLHARIQESNLDIEVIRLFQPANENSAYKLGQQFGCTILIWGWYDRLTVNPNVEKITTNECKPTYDIADAQKLVLTTNQELNLNITSNLPNQVAYLTLYILATDQWYDGKSTEALKLINEALINFEDCQAPFDVSAGFRLRGDLYRCSMGIPETAKQNYECAIKIAPQNPVSYFSHAQVVWNDEKQRNDDLTKAIKLYSQQLNTASLNYDYLRGRGHAYIQVDNFKDAVTDFKNALQIKSDYSVAHRDLGYAYRLEMQYDLAIEQFQLATKINSKDADAYLNLGLAYKGRNSSTDKESAIQYLNKALENSSEYSWIYKAASDALKQLTTN